jgi:hypothetical protein
MSEAAQTVQPTDGEPALSIIQTTTYSFLWNDKGSGSNMDCSIYRPTTSDSSYFIIGDYAVGNYVTPVGPSFMVKAKDDDPNNPVIKRPVDYEFVWDDKGAGTNHDGSIWLPIPPAGYVAVGAVCQMGYTKPSTSIYACIRLDLCVVTQAGPLIWNDKGSGASRDVSLYQIIGVPGSFVAQANYNPYSRTCYRFAQS